MAYSENIRVMLVIDGVEFDVFDQFEQMRKLDRRRAVGFQQHGNAGDEVVEQRARAPAHCWR